MYTCYNELVSNISVCLFMPGNKNSGRPGGNPNIKRHGFKSDRDEPLRSRLQLRVADSMKQQLDLQDDWQEFVRQAIAEKLQSA